MPGRKRVRESSHFGSSAAPLWGGLFRPSASGARRGVALRLCLRGSSRRFSQRCLSTHICCHFASGNLIGAQPQSRRRSLQIYRRAGDLVLARPRPLTLRTGRRQSSPPTASTRQRRSLATVTTTLGGGVQRLRVRGCGKRGDVEIHTLHNGSTAGTGMQTMPVWGRSVPERL